MTASRKRIKPQRAQVAFISSSAFLTLFGGAGGGGKTWALLLDPLKYIHIDGFAGIIFRRLSTLIRSPGGLLDKSREIYPHLGGQLRETTLDWVFPTPTGGQARLSFRHLKDLKAAEAYQGLEIAWAGFDELTHFSAEQFWFIVSRMRSLCGIVPQIKATCNPDVDSWVRELVDGWIAPDGYVDPEKAGNVRFFTRRDDKLIWVSSKWRDEDSQPANSMIFLRADIWDNQELLRKNPEYLRNLRSLPLVQRERLLGRQGRGGNWNIRLIDGQAFNRGWFPIVDLVPQHGELLRFWDFAGTETGDYTASVLGLKLNEELYILNVTNDRYSPHQLDSIVANTAMRDVRAKIRWEQEPGQSGLYQTYSLLKVLTGKDAGGCASRLDKLSRSEAFSKACEQGKVKLFRANWNERFLRQLETFPKGDYDDMVDAASGLYNCLYPSVGSFSARKYKY